MRAFVLSISAAVVSGLVVGAQPETLSVCNVLEAGQQYDGHLVTVRGEYRWGAHGAWLVASTGCPFKLITKQVRWPNLVFLTFPIHQSKHPEFRADFDVDLKAINAAQGRIGHENFDVRTSCLVEVVTGRLVLIHEPEKHVNPPELGGNILGFGPSGLGAPAQLLMKSMSRPEIVARSSTRGREFCAPAGDW